MTFVRRLAAALTLFAALLTMSSCVVRRRLITRKGSQAKQTLLTASKDDLLRRIQAIYDSIQSFQADVDMTPSVGSVYKGEITEYKDVSAYILYKKPDEIRIIGLYPVVRSKAFDMVSNGDKFRIFIPAKNRFIEGETNLPANSPNKIENLRPEAFLSALLIRPPKEPEETAVLEDFTDEENAYYILHILRNPAVGQITLLRNIWFDRLSLRIVRQKKFDEAGNILSDTRYTNWQTYNGVPFPSSIDINRPKDEYGVVMTVTKMEMNPTLTADKFVLEQPEGTQLEVLGANALAPNPPSGTKPPAPKTVPPLKEKK
jgi:outer membrane lipoprotein-sorting protein